MTHPNQVMTHSYIVGVEIKELKPKIEVGETL